VGQLGGPPLGDPSRHPDRRSDRRRGVGRCCGPRNALTCRDAFAEVRHVVVVDDERPGQHGLEVAGEAALGTPREVVPRASRLTRRRGPQLRQARLVLHHARDQHRLAAARALAARRQRHTRRSGMEDRDRLARLPRRRHRCLAHGCSGSRAGDQVGCGPGPVTGRSRRGFGNSCGPGATAGQISASAAQGSSRAWAAGGGYGRGARAGQVRRAGGGPGWGGGGQGWQAVFAQAGVVVGER